MTVLKDYIKGFLPPKKGSPIPDIPDLLNEVISKSRDILPKGAFVLLDAINTTKEKDLKDLKCQLDKESGKGQDQQCALGRNQVAYREKLQQNRLDNKPKQLLKQKPRKFKSNFPQRGLTTKLDNFKKTKFNQNLDLRASNYNDKVTKFNVPKSKFENEYDPLNPNSTLGNKALLFDVNGKVLKTANEIGREGRMADISSGLSTGTSVRTQAPRKNNTKRDIKNLGDAIDRVKGTGEINSLAALFSAITGMVAIIAVLAVLVPMSFLTVALNWLQTITTMLTNVKDVATTYLSISEAGLTLFGYPKSTSKIKTFVNDIAYGIFGKDNYESAKSAFAQGILNLTSMTKLLEKIESGRNGTNSKIDGVAFSLGTANNALKEGGLIPPDSPWSQYSEKVDKLVEDQAKVSSDPDLKENIQKLTTEILTQDEIDKEIKEETEAKTKLQARKQKEIDNLQNLGVSIKPIINAQIADSQE